MRPLTALLMLSACSDKADDTLADTAVASQPTEETDADADGYPADEDCDDDDATAHPGAEEICDGIDNNCDGQTDEGVLSTFYADDDGDGFGDAESVTEACEVPEGHVAISTDCDDADADSYPGAAERCDGLDNDCDEEVDEDVQEVWYADADGDGFGDASATTEACDPPPGYVDDSTDCDDTAAAASPDGIEVCDDLDNDCDGDTDEGVTTTFYQDTDGDGYGLSDATAESCDALNGYAAVAGDCDDTDGTISPNAAELCDGVDNDCDGDTDEDSAADAHVFYADSDSDSYGDDANYTLACEQPSGYVSDFSDCDDTDADTHPGSSELCDEVDNDCDGDIDEDATDADTWYGDGDGDGYGATTFTTESCSAPTGYVDNYDDCDDSLAENYPGAEEQCDDADNDCDGDIDEGVEGTFYADSDSDGQGDPDTTTDDCAAPSGYVDNSYDCDDTDATISPNAAELCDGVDNDCDGDIDIDAVDSELYYADADSDGYGDAATSEEGCSAPTGYVDSATDCDDTSAQISPDAAEVCDGVDNNCDGQTDEDEAALGGGASCPATDCLEIYDAGAGTTDGTYFIEHSDGTEEVYCLMDGDYGGGWMLVAVVSDDGQDTWTWSNSAYWETDTTAVGDVDSRSDDYRSPALALVPMSDLLAIHAPSGVWTEYDDVGDSSESLGEIIEAIGAHVAYGASEGYTMTDGTLSTDGTALCSTNMAFNACGLDGYDYCTDYDDAYGPVWSIDNNNGCPWDDTNVTGGVGPSYTSQSSELSVLGFAYDATLNTGTSGASENYLQIFIR